MATFISNGTPITSPSPQYDIPLVSNNGALKVSKNLFDKNSYTEINAYVNANTGVLTQGSPGENTQYCAVIPCKPNTTYTISGRSTSAWGAFTSSNIGTTATSYNKTVNGSITTGANDIYLIGLVRANSDTVDYRDVLQVEQGSTATPYRPYGQIYTDGTVETIWAHGKNLVSSLETGKYIRVGNTTAESPLGSVVSASTLSCTGYIKVSPSTTYTSTIPRIANSSSAGLCYYGSNTVESAISGVSLTTQAGLIYTFTTPANCNYVRFSWYNQDGNNAQLEQGSTATTYEPYFNGGTATAEMLLKVGDYQDVQSIIDGVVTRKVGVKVLDGTEDWADAGTYGANSYRFTLDLSAPSTDDVRALCTHIDRIIQSNTTSQSNRPCIRFNITGASIYWYGEDNTTTLAQFKQWLAGQYNAGTPVIIVYPLATPTTESVTGQTLQVTDGDNVLEITQASLNGLELEAEYQAAVSLTIQEVQDANLDNNVTVTIQ